MKKNLSNCVDCGEVDFMLTQVNSGPEVASLCVDCYNLKYSNELQQEIEYVEKKIKKKKTKKKEFSYYGLGKFNYFTFKFFCSRFVFNN